MSIADIVASVARKSPQMGGSTASSACALIGIAMAEMAIVISLARNGGDEGLSHVEGELKGLSAQLAEAAEEDRIQFQRYMATLRGNTQANSDRNDRSLKEAAAEATYQPLTASEILVDCLELLASAIGRIDHIVASDLFSGAAIIRAAFSGAMMAAEVNLAGERLADIREETANQRKSLTKRSDAAFDSISMAARGGGFSV
jgi:formiminotetrahydrofolate cyclodeaminase